MTSMLMTRAGSTFCSICGWGGIEVDDGYFEKAWEQRVGQCPGCAADFNYWDRLVATVSDRSDLWHAVTLAGGFTTTFLQSVPSRKTFMLQFSDYGIPEGAIIYKVVQTVQEGGTPQGITVLAHAAQALGGQLDARMLALHPVLVGAAGTCEDDQPTEISVAFTVVWAPHRPDSLAQGLLMSAFGAYAEGDMKRCLLDADSAVDISLKQIVKAELIPGWDRKLPNLGYEQRLLVLMAALSAPDSGTIPTYFLNLLLDLRAERNKVAHGTNENVNAAQAASLISGALVAMSQLVHLQD